MSKVPGANGEAKDISDRSSSAANVGVDGNKLGGRMAPVLPPRSPVPPRVHGRSPPLPTPPPTPALSNQPVLPPQAPALPPRSRSNSGSSSSSPLASPHTNTNTSANNINNAASTQSLVKSASRPPPAPVTRSSSSSMASVAPQPPEMAAPRPPSGRFAPPTGGPARSRSGGDGAAGGGAGRGGGRPPHGMIHRSSSERELLIGGDGSSDGGEASGDGWGDGDGRFQDAQDVLMPTLSIYDPERLWEYVERPMMVYMPLRKLSAKPPAVSSPANIEEVPVRCLVHRTLAGTEVAARRVDSPAERYRASFAFIYMVSAESLEHYKQTVRPLIREWIDKVEARGGGMDGGGWLLLYVIVAPQGGGSSSASAAASAGIEAQGNIFWWLCADFYSKAAGDRCSLVSLYVDQSGFGVGGGGGIVGGGGQMLDQRGGPRPRARPSASPRHHPKQWSDLLTKVGRVVMEVFEARVACYNAELSRLDATQGMIGWDFGEFFVVKESLALMFKELQLPAEALLKYQELAALILTMGEDAGTLSCSSSPESGAADGGLRERNSGARELLFGLGIPGDPERLPASVLDYGKMRFRERVNGGKLHSLVLETQLYIFARQCSLNLELKRPAEVARMGGRFMPAYYHELVGQVEERGGGDGYSSPRAMKETSSPSAASLSPLEVELFAFKSSWDVVKACDRYFAYALNPNGLEPPARELAAIRLARVETSRYLAELLEFAQTRLLEYARLVAEEMSMKGMSGDVDGGLMASCVWELQDRGFLASQRDWVPQNEEGDKARGAPRRTRSGRMRVDGGVIEVETVSGQYFWDCDEEGEVFIPPQESGSRSINPIKDLTGGDGAPSPRKTVNASTLMTDFDDEDSDETQESADSATATIRATPMTTSAATAAASVIATAAATAVRPLRSSSSTSTAGTSAGAPGAGGGVGTRLDRPALLEDAYLQMTHSLAQHNQRAGRVRAAARCWGKRAELLLERGEVGVAQARLAALADLYQAEGWLPQAFWVLHRLARCRRALLFSSRDRTSEGNGVGVGGGDVVRASGGRGSYVSTVMRLAAMLKDPRVRSEGGKVAVERATAALLRDTHAMCSLTPCTSGSSASPADALFTTEDARASGGEDSSHVYRLRCVAAPELAVLDGGGESEEGEGVVGKKPDRTIPRNPGTLPCVDVGDTLRVSCVLTSHLPEALTFDALELEMVFQGSTLCGGGGGRYGMNGIGGGGDGDGGGVGGGEVERMGHRRAPSAARRTLRRLESVATITAGDNGDGAASHNGKDQGSNDAVAPPALSKLNPPPPVITTSGARGTATQALTAGLVINGDGDWSGIGAEAAAAAAAEEREWARGQRPAIGKARSQSLSPRSSSKKGSFGRASIDVGGGGGGGRGDDGVVNGGRGSGSGDGGRGGAHSGYSRNLMQIPPAAGGGSSGSRLPRVRTRPVCWARVAGPIEIVPGENKVVFLLRPMMPGIITASRVSAIWGGARLVEVFPPGGRGAGAVVGRPTVVTPSVVSGAPQRPPSAVVRPFRPRATLEVLSPSFVPAGCGGWVRLVIDSRCDTLRGARLLVGLGQGLAWGDVGLATVSLNRVEAEGKTPDGDDDNSEDAGADATPVRARQIDGNLSEIAVELPDLIEAGWRAEVSLRLRSTAAAAHTPYADARVGDLAPIVRACTVKAELQAWHWRGLAFGPVDSECEVQLTGSARRDSLGGERGDLAGTNEAGVECRIRARAGIAVRLPFEGQATVLARPRGVVLAEAALVCRAPVALSLRSVEIAGLEDGAGVLADPNTLLSGVVLPPGQPLRLAACLQRAVDSGGGGGGGGCIMGGDTTELPSDPPLGILRLSYVVTDESTESSMDAAATGDSQDRLQSGNKKHERRELFSAGNKGKEKEEFVFQVAIPRPREHCVTPSSRSSSSTSGHRITVMTLVEPCEFGGASGASTFAKRGDDDPLRLKLAEPRAFEFGVDTDLAAVSAAAVGGGVACAAQLVAFRVLASPLDWMVSGLVRGLAKLHAEGGKQILCKVHLVPIRGGLLPLPRLDVVPGGNSDSANIVVWTPKQRKVLVLPTGDFTSVCQARSP